MREIKFRAWVYKDSKMDYNKPQHSTLTRSFAYGHKDAELMQYIGLKDKNGVEIYKGDLLQDDKNRLFEVISDCRISHTGYLMDCIKNKSETDHIQIGRFYEFKSWLYPDNFLEVIGNIYEHKHLIE